MNEPKVKNDHEKFRELGALANSGVLSPRECAELKYHLQKCDECREVYTQYLALASEGMPMLAARYGSQTEQGSWDDRRVLEKIRARIWAHGRKGSSTLPSHLEAASVTALLSRISPNRFLLASTALTACLAVAVALVYHVGSMKLASASLAQASAEDRFQRLAVESKNSLDERLGVQARDLFRLQEEGSRKQSELAKLRSEMRTLEDHASELEAARNATDEQLQTLVAQREALTLRLKDAERANQQVEADFVNLRSEREKAAKLSVSLESKINELSAINKDQERKLKGDEQFLASDQDIRELMGARKLYIADIFDVDSRSLTRKPFGRVFYTEGKSLIVYAFDLDHQQDLKNADTFQAWGQREDRGRPLNLGIFYMDSESNRRWVLRVDDSTQLAGIDTMFVTVEPHGGSPKPTGKPFLYASLRKEANHP
jgi:anti-sigma-K factor RskA